MIFLDSSVLIIASSAILAAAELYHVDRHFTGITEASDLSERYVGRAGE